MAVAAGVATAGAVSPAAAGADGVPAVGAPAFAFATVDQDGGAVSVAALAGRRFVLAFYPRDFTPG
jgi:hypothetical protein